METKIFGVRRIPFAACRRPADAICCYVYLFCCIFRICMISLWVCSYLGREHTSKWYFYKCSITIAVFLVTAHMWHSLYNLLFTCIKPVQPRFKLCFELSRHIYTHHITPWPVKLMVCWHRRRLGAEFGGRKHFWMTFFRKKFSFPHRKFLMTFFSHLFCFLPLFTVWHLIYNIYGPFL